MINPIPMGLTLMVLSSMGFGNSVMGMFSWFAVLQSTKLPAEPESIRADTTEEESEYLIIT